MSLFLSILFYRTPAREPRRPEGKRIFLPDTLFLDGFGTRHRVFSSILSIFTGITSISTVIAFWILIYILQFQKLPSLVYPYFRFLCVFIHCFCFHFWLFSDKDMSFLFSKALLPPATWTPPSPFCRAEVLRLWSPDEEHQQSMDPDPPPSSHPCSGSHYCLSAAWEAPQ